MAKILYYRERYYNSYLNQFQSRDPFPGYDNLSQSQNGYSYGLNNPVNLIDPSGLDPWWCNQNYPGVPSYGQEDAAANCINNYNSPPSSRVPCAENQSGFCILENGGYLDVVHFRASKRLAESLIERQLPTQIGKRFGFVFLSQPLGGGILPYGAGYYTNITPGITRDKLIGVAFGIFLDYQYEFETIQGLDPRCYSFAGMLGSHCSSFSNEDLPSDYLGFVSHAKNLSFDSIINILGGGWQSNDAPTIYYGESWPVSDPALCALGICGNFTPFNNQCTLKIYDEGTGQYVNRPWPSVLELKSIGPGDYWARNISDFYVTTAPTPPVSGPTGTPGTPSAP